MKRINKNIIMKIMKLNKMKLLKIMFKMKNII